MKAQYDIVTATVDHIEPIANNCRQADMNECWAIAALTIREALMRSLATADEALVGRANEEPGVMYGVTSGGDRIGQIWLISTYLVDQHQRAFLERSRLEFARFKAQYDRLFNFVDVRNKKAIRWLRWLGFTVDGPINYGLFGQPFYYFYWEKEQNHDSN